MAPSAISPPAPDSSTGKEAALPIISLTPLLERNPSSAQSAAGSLLSAFKTSGFLYLKDSPIPDELLSEVYALSAQFFARPFKDKNTLAWTTPKANRGFSSQGREKTSLGLSKDEVGGDRDGVGEDQKESFEMGREGEEGCPNQWPEGDVKFKEVMLDFHERCRKLHAVVMRGIAIGMGLDPDFFADFVKQGDNTLRLLHYPGVSSGAFANGGLQVERQDGSFTDVTPIEGTIVLNAGDMLSRWSNGEIRSTRHRVVEPPVKARDGYPPRYSVAYFCNPDFDKTIDALPGTYGGDEGEKKWEPVNSGKYLEDRLTATY
ncbi:MAG: hypothetical protein Q9174_005177 [Haloplaca sp. 1 TL-2023]